jgi:tight adherence protein B
VIGLAIGLCAGLGLFSVWWSCWPVDDHGRPGRSSRRRRLDRWTDDLVLAGVPGLGVWGLLALGAGSGLVVFLLALGLTHVVAVAGCFGVMAAAAPVVLVRSTARRRRSQLRDVWPDVVDNLASAVRAGLSLPEALGQLSLRGPDQLRPSFAAFAHDYRASGRFNDSLDRLKERLSDPVGDRVVESLRVARDVGGSDLGRLLRTLSSFLRQDARTRAELESRQSWTVNGARLAVAAPWIVLAMLSTRPESIAAYDRPAGALVLVIGGVVTLVAYRVMLRIARLPEEQRVLR